MFSTRVARPLRAEHKVPGAAAYKCKCGLAERIFKPGQIRNGVDGNATSTPTNVGAEARPRLPVGSVGLEVKGGGDGGHGFAESKGLAG